DGRRGDGIQAQWIIGVVNAERRVHDRQENLQFKPSGHSRDPVREWRRAEGGSKIERLLPGTVQAHVEIGTAVLRVLQKLQFRVGNSQLRGAQNRINAKVREGRDRDFWSNRDSVFQVAHHLQIAAREDRLVSGNLYRVVPPLRIGLVEWHCGTIRILQ